MRKALFLLMAAPAAISSPALAEAERDAPANSAEKAEAPAAPPKEVFSTGVAKGRDRLDSATSTSALRGDEIQKFGPRALGDVLRTMAGLRVASGIGEGNNNYTVRGLPLAAGGSKYMQFQEDGLPVLEFGDLFNVGTDVYLRNDFTVNQIETIRGGSASTFASNSPGGLINLISRTGDVEGGSVQLSTGLDYDEKRLDFAMGGRLNRNTRFHIGGFYRQGEGPRRIGFDGWRGGQVKLNVTREFDDGGYVRVYLKYLDDRSPTFAPYVVNITGTNDNPTFQSFPGFDLRRDSVLSRYLGPVITLDQANNLAALPIDTGQHAVSKSFGFETQFDIAGWTITERARFAANGGDFSRAFPNSANTVSAFAAGQSGAGATASYASGPLTGQPIPGGSLINGNGLLQLYFVSFVRARNLDNFTNDLRASRVWELPGGKLTTTGGLYVATQALSTTWLHTAMNVDANGGGNTAMVNIANAAGVQQTVNGYFAFARASSLFRRAFDVDYRVVAPYGSINYHFGKIAIGGSLRYDMGRVRGQLVGADLGEGRVGLTSQDINRDGVISAAETRVAFLPFDRPGAVSYNYGYLNYSAGVNYRVAEPFSVFARYSHGARANADKVLFTPLINNATGAIANERDKADGVTQIEGGFKFRKDGITLNGTVFRVTADDHNVLNGAANRTDRSYEAHGVELEGTIQRGPFSMMVGATYTRAKITLDRLDPTLTGKEPRHQPDWTLVAVPQLDLGRLSAGASIVTITGSYAQDNNLLRMPGFTTVGSFLQFAATDRLRLTLNAQNLFNTLGIFEVNQSAVPANGIGFARAANGRTVSGSLRFDF
ncbi:TonB-dependent receptor domain-containing protein [Novosphingobium piscinae]|uniref:TonB-dependent receptor n=1 Tax=Novosphingobium piscinae TaxID=1507448 RepID=A0A7X1KQH5_9SPHN|nr:TonB-dependent receptor [Novosphingobium piscinae]MBC2669555.1 TonB-dependent receptor [Novosphingobium piscinae]